MFWGIVNICGGMFLLIVGFRPQWISDELGRELSSKPKRITFVKWGGPIVLILGALQLLGVI